MQKIEYHFHVNHVESEKRFEYGPYENFHAPELGEYFVLPLIEDSLSGEVIAKTIFFDPGVRETQDVTPKIIIEISF
jgi:hypothetical protein